MALFFSMFSMGLQLPFCRHVLEVLDSLWLTLFKLLRNAWRILISCCVAWHLGPMSDEYPNLIAHKFIYTHGIWHLEGNQCSFCSWMGSRVVCLEPRFSHSWHNKFFFVSSFGWEYSVNKASHHEFLVRTI